MQLKAKPEVHLISLFYCKHNECRNITTFTCIYFNICLLFYGMVSKIWLKRTIMTASLMMQGNRAEPTGNIVIQYTWALLSKLNQLKAENITNETFWLPEEKLPDLTSHSYLSINFQVQLPHSWHDGLAALGVKLHTECGVFPTEPGDSFREVVDVTLVNRFDWHGDNRLRNVHRLLE